MEPTEDPLFPAPVVSTMGYMKTVSILHITAGVVIALFVLQMTKRLAAQSNNPIAAGVSQGVDFLTS